MADLKEVRKQLGLASASLLKGSIPVSLHALRAIVHIDRADGLLSSEMPSEHRGTQEEPERSPSSPREHVLRNLPKGMMTRLENIILNNGYYELVEGKWACRIATAADLGREFASLQKLDGIGVGMLNALRNALKLYGVNVEL